MLELYVSTNREGECFSLSPKSRKAFGKSGTNRVWLAYEDGRQGGEKIYEQPEVVRTIAGVILRVPIFSGVVEVYDPVEERLLSRFDYGEVVPVLERWEDQPSATNDIDQLRQEFRARLGTEGGETLTQDEAVRRAVETHECPYCGAEMDCESKHERDSSNDVHFCPRCRWSYSQWAAWAAKRR